MPDPKFDHRVTSLAPFFRPSSVAVVGASPREGSGGYRIFRNLVRLVDGTVYPVHPTASEILGRECYSSITGIPNPVDLAVVYVPSSEIPAIVEDCIAAGVKAVCVEAGGFADAGEQGARLQGKLSELAADSGIRIWGPNCAGYVTTHPYLSTAFVEAPPSLPVGSTSMVFQSGMAAAAMLAEITSLSLISIDKACSIGNKVDVDEADLLGYLAMEGTSRTVALYLESIVDGGRFGHALRSLLPDTVVCGLMGNKTRGGFEAAATHTGAVMMQSNAVGSYLRHHGVVEAADFTELLQLAKTYEVSGPRRGGPRVAILTFSGAAGVVAADLLESQGMTLAGLSERTLDELRELFPDWYRPSNPVDIWSTVELRGFSEATSRSVESVLADDGVDAVLFVPLAFDHYTVEDIRRFAGAVGQSEKPVVLWPIGDADVVESWSVPLREAGVPICPGLGLAVSALAGFDIRTKALDREAVDRALVSKRAADDPSELPIPDGLSSLGEVESKRFLSRLGIPVVDEVVTTSREHALAAARAMGYPVVLKLAAAGLSHKTEIGGVALDVVGDARVEAEYDRLMESAVSTRLNDPRVLVQPMVGEGIEVIVGIKCDVSLGWFVVVGMGGVDVESLSDVAMRPAPVTEGEAETMIRELRGIGVLTAGRGGRVADVGALARAVALLSGVADRPPLRVEAIEVNPLLVLPSGRGVLAVDGLITLSDQAAEEGRPAILSRPSVRSEV